MYTTCCEKLALFCGALGKFPTLKASQKDTFYKRGGFFLIAGKNILGLIYERGEIVFFH